ncbi:TrmH family RNA methyltransferase [Riemerella columbina]|uniref:TrmH family RNA methyltransferase n=1 Tax=Riemerella columbina TaxID=103810 RepID=UPI00266F6602|nr:TrmH family RNA methyltransferase [Riemerella columbina]WKS94656.1 TrmH family RNA methyltransferase [Riemerella columbina]
MLKRPMMQLEHSEIENSKHNLEISLVLEHLQSPQNIGLIIRTAEAMGVQKIFVLSEKYQQLNPKIKAITRATEDYIEVIFVQDWSEILARLTPEKVHFYALEKTSHSVDYRSVSYKFPCVLICGNERYGVSEEALKLSEKHLHLPMYGRNTSMNVAMATGIALAQMVASPSTL